MSTAVRLQQQQQQQTQQQQQLYTELLLKSYAGHLSRSMIPQSANLRPPLVSGFPALPVVMATGLRPPIVAQAHSPPPISPFAPGLQSMGSFQHLLAMMSARNGQRSSLGTPETGREETSMTQEERIPSPARSVSPSDGSLSADISQVTSSSPEDSDRKSSSITALRIRAKAYEMKLQLGQQYNNGIVY